MFECEGLTTRAQFKVRRDLFGRHQRGIRMSSSTEFDWEAKLHDFRYDSSLLNQFGCKGKPNSPASPMATPNAANTSEVQSSQRLRVKAVTASMANETDSAASDKSN